MIQVQFHKFDAQVTLQILLLLDRPQETTALDRIDLFRG